jgi:hypothetical protein
MAVVTDKDSIDDILVSWHAAFGPFADLARVSFEKTESEEQSTNELWHEYLEDWWTRWESNPRPSGCEPDALPAELLALLMVSATGIEPATSSVSRKRSTAELRRRQ